jgi:hypothetical protein
MPSLKPSAVLNLNSDAVGKASMVIPDLEVPGMPASADHFALWPKRFGDHGFAPIASQRVVDQLCSEEFL